MKTFYLIFLFLILAQMCWAQNLVPNPGFEDYVNCPGNGVIKGPYYPATQTVSDWINPTRATPDYFACTGGLTGVPDNFLGKIPPHNGNAYGGIRAVYIYISIRQEYLQVKLLQPLKQDTTYLISCFVWCQLADAGNRNRALDRIQVAFTQSALTENALTILKANATDLQTPSKDFIMPAEGWVKISGHYTASGGEEWLTIGMFNDDGLNHTKKIDPDGSGSNHCAYYTIDDVSVEVLTCDSTFNSSDTLVCDLNPDLTVYTTAPSESYMHLWNTGSQELSLNITKPGVYWCTGTSGCNIITDTFHVKMFTDTTTTPATILPCTTTKLATSFDADAYRWSTGDTTRTIATGKQGEFWCNAVKDCRLMVDTFLIEKIDTLQLPRRFINTCIGDTYTLSAATTGKSYKWKNGAITKDISFPTAYRVDTCFITVDECMVVVEPFSITAVYPSTRYAEHKKDTTACGTIELVHKYDFEPKYRWNTGDSVCCISVSKTGIYTVSLTLDGCPPWTDTVAVTITDCENCMFIPSAFTPNNDGLNDLFRAIPSCPINTFTFRIFNRWGQEVFYTTDPRKGWNGMHGADIADVGTYYYFVEYTSVAAGKTELLKGDVLLLK